MSKCYVLRPLDYDDVSLVVVEDFAALDTKPRGPLGFEFRLGPHVAGMPFLFCYEAPEGCAAIEEACAAAGVLTIGPVGSKVPLSSHSAEARMTLYEDVDPTSAASLGYLSSLKAADRCSVVSCSNGTQAIKLANAKLADAILIGPATAAMNNEIQSCGLSVARVSVVKRAAADVPVLATAASSAEACKAFVAGADAVVLHLGGPFAEPSDVVKLIPDVVSSLRRRLETLCSLAGAKSLKELTYRCRLIPK